MSDQNNQQPGLISTHAEYIKGAAVNAVGSVTGNEAWTQSGSETKEHAVQGMREATQNRDPNNSGYGKAEEIAGKVTGCEGMKEEGAASASQK